MQGWVCVPQSCAGIWDQGPGHAVYFLTKVCPSPALAASGGRADADGQSLQRFLNCGLLLLLVLKVLRYKPALYWDRFPAHMGCTQAGEEQGSG